MIVGYISQVFFSVCLLPQLFKLYTAKTTKGLSWGMWFFQALGYFFGLSYGLHLTEWPLILGNLWGILCTIFFAVGFWRYRNV